MQDTCGFTVDLVAPSTEITAGPLTRVPGDDVPLELNGPGHVVKFVFQAADEEESGWVEFQCWLSSTEVLNPVDAVLARTARGVPAALGEWTTCASPAVYTAVAPGSWEFRVRSRDLAGNLEEDPQVVAFSTQLSPEAVYARVDNGPYGGVNVSDVSFAVSAVSSAGAVNAAGFICSLFSDPDDSRDEVSSQPATGGVCSYGGLQDGEYEVVVAVADNNPDDEDLLAVHKFRVDTIPPVVTFTGDVAGGFVMGNELMVTVTADETVGFECWFGKEAEREGAELGGCEGALVLGEDELVYTQVGARVPAFW